MISVVMPVRNGLPYLPQAIDSVLRQSHGDLELIVIDDGSTDGSGNAARAIDDSRIRVITVSGLGVARALNVGLASARGCYIARQDADDLSEPARFAKQAAYLDGHTTAVAVASRVRFIDDGGHSTSTQWTEAVATQWETATTPQAIRAMLPQTCCIVHGSVMMRRDALIAAGGYNPALPAAQDYDLWLRLLAHGDIARVPETLYAFRIHDRQISASRRHQQRAEAIAAKLRYLRATCALPDRPAARIMGCGAGFDLYRDALHANGWIVDADPCADVTIFTQFATLDQDMRAMADAAPAAMIRIGNFLVAGQPS